MRTNCIFTALIKKNVKKNKPHIVFNLKSFFILFGFSNKIRNTLYTKWIPTLINKIKPARCVPLVGQVSPRVMWTSPWAFCATQEHLYWSVKERKQAISGWSFELCYVARLHKRYGAPACRKQTTSSPLQGLLQGVRMVHGLDKNRIKVKTKGSVTQHTNY